MGRRGPTSRTRRRSSRRTTTCSRSSRRTSRPARHTRRSTVTTPATTSRYLFKTTDFGQTWTQHRGEPPATRPHQRRQAKIASIANLLFVGTEFGFYVSLDGGKAWSPLMRNLPATTSDDVLVHPRDQDLVLATHGRSFFVLDDITPLQQLVGRGAREERASVPSAPGRFCGMKTSDVARRRRRSVPGEESAGRDRLVLSEGGGVGPGEDSGRSICGGERRPRDRRSARSGPASRDVGPASGRRRSDRGGELRREAGGERSNKRCAARGPERSESLGPAKAGLLRS